MAAAAPYVDRFVAVNGVKLHFQDWDGPPGAPTLLMVHGITMQSHAFDPVAAAMKARYRCLALDLRGHGDSAWSDEPYDYAAYAKDVLAFLDALGIETTHYLGTSLGGRIAMVMAAAQPGRFASLALNDISPLPAGAGIVRIREIYGRERPPFASIEAYVEQVLFAYVPRLRALPMPVMAQSARWSLRPVEGGLRMKFDPRALERLAQAGTPADTEHLWRGFRALRCPLLLLRAEQSDIVPPEAVRLMREAQPGLRAVEVPGVGHPPLLVEPAAREALEAFFPGG